MLEMEDDEFLAQLAAAEAEALASASAAKRLKVTHPTPTPPPAGGAYLEALKGSKGNLFTKQSASTTTNYNNSSNYNSYNINSNNNGYSNVGLSDGGSVTGTGSCFKCGKLGHWSRYCDAKGDGIGDGDVVEKQCPCGVGVCNVLTAKTEKNCGRKFYKCPIRQESGGCGFFEWCDNGSGPETVLKVSNPSAPELSCPCGAGSCSVLTAKTEKNLGQQFYKCPANQDIIMGEPTPTLEEGNTMADYWDHGSNNDLDDVVNLEGDSQVEELLKRKGLSENVNESSASLVRRMGLSNGVLSGIKKTDQTKNPKYIDTRMDHLFPVRKNSTRLSLPSDNGTVKDNHTGIANNSYAPSHLAAENLLTNKRSDQTPALTSAVKDYGSEPFSTIGKCSTNTFRTVRELSDSREKLAVFSDVDMHKALKGLIMPEPLLGPLSQAHSFGEDCHRKPPNSDIQIPGNKTPLDLTLKTSMRIVSSSSISWFHRAVNCKNTQFSWSASVRERDLFHSSGAVSSSQALNKICSWVYPQSPLPPVVISALSLAVGEGGQMDFLNKRQQAWEDAFRSVYYMLRKKFCNVFYVCTTQFVVMFTGSDNLKTERRNCNAYISQSTRGLRSLLKEHDISYSMPLCQSKPEEVTAEDLVELSEIAKQTLGQAQNTRNMSDIDKSPQSLLVFAGNENVHGLYEFLLNYRYFMTSMTGLDVPILCSPVPFENAALSAPEIRCKELRKAEHMSMLVKEPIAALEVNQGSSNMCYSIEIKDAYLPPWVICSVCDAIGADGNTFEASFVPETTSIGLNVGLDIFHQGSDVHCATDGPLQNNDNPLGINNAAFSPHIRSGFVKHLKFSSDSYIASVSTV